MTTAADARARVREAGGPELLERLVHLDTVRRPGGSKATPEAPPQAPSRVDAMDVDVAIAGGGLWSLLAPLLAARGLRVVVLDRARAAAAHREWNASGAELEALVRCGLVDRATLDELVVARYARGVCRFAGGATHSVTGVLDHAVDAGALLAHGRRSAERAGVRFLDGHGVVAHAAGATGVRLRARSAHGDTEITARVMVDARGASSPYAKADLVCPTVGGVLGGLIEGDAPDETNPEVGEILATVDGVKDGRQHVWEAFPGRRGETTVYLFYYARAGEALGLLDLYARFFATLPEYKRGDARLLRPTFGLIPGWSRIAPPPTSDHPRVVLVGDAAARHSPLTYCGFGSALRSLAGAAKAIERRASGASRDAADVSVVDDAAIHGVTGALAHLVASGAFAGQEANALLDAAFTTLAELGDDTFARFLRDELPAKEAVAFLTRTARRHPAVWSQVLRGLGARNAGRWGARVFRSMWSG